MQTTLTNPLEGMTREQAADFINGLADLTPQIIRAQIHAHANKAKHATNVLSQSPKDKTAREKLFAEIKLQQDRVLFWSVALEAHLAGRDIGHELQEQTMQILFNRAFPESRTRITGPVEYGKIKPSTSHCGDATCGACNEHNAQ